MSKWLPLWLLTMLSLLAVTAQCTPASSPSHTPALPVTPTGPTIRVALLSPTTGEMATVGRMMRNGVVMAFDEWNAQGGVLDHRLEWSIYDTKCKFETARQAAHQAVDEGARFIIGPLCSEAAIAAATVAEASRILMISPTATHPLVTINGQGKTRPTVFRASYTYPWQGNAAARFAIGTLGSRKAALLYQPHDDYSSAVASAFAQAFGDHGGQIVYRATYDSAGDTGFSDTLSAIRRSDAEVIYVPAPALFVNQVAQQLNMANTTAISPRLTLLGSDTWASTELDLNATEGSYYTLHFANADDRPQIKSWAEAYQASYAIEPDTLAVLSYDAAQLLILAIQQAGTFETAAIVNALEQGTFETVTGPITFDDQHNPKKSVPIVRIDGGNISVTTVVSP